MNFSVLSKTESALRLVRVPTQVFLLLSFLLLTLFAGCSRRVERQADLIIVNGAEPESLDPAIITGQADSRVVLSLFEGLTRFDPATGKGVAAMAEKWEISADGRVYA